MKEPERILNEAIEAHSPTCFTAEFDEPQPGFGVDCYMVDYDGCPIHLIGATPDLTRHIVHCVNNYDLLREALRLCAEVMCDGSRFVSYSQQSAAAHEARTLLTELDNLENGS